jgi:hypothetical protein
MAKKLIFLATHCFLSHIITRELGLHFYFICVSGFLGGIDNRKAAQFIGPAVLSFDGRTCNAPCHFKTNCCDGWCVANHVGVCGIRQWAVAFASLNAPAHFIGLHCTPGTAKVVVMLTQIAN